MNYSVKVVKLGRFQVPNWEVYWMSKFNVPENSDPLPLTLNMVVIQGGGKTAIVNTGPSKDMIPVLDAKWRKLFGEDAGLHVDESEYIENALASVGVKPEDCTVYDDSVAACRGAKGAGMQTVGVYDPYFDMTWDEMQTVCDRCIKSFEELV